MDISKYAEVEKKSFKNGDRVFYSNAENKILLGRTGHIIDNDGIDCSVVQWDEPLKNYNYQDRDFLMCKNANLTEIL